MTRLHLRMFLSSAVALMAFNALAGGAPVAGAQNQAPPDQGQDPAAANLAPSGPSYTTQAPPPPEPVGRSGPASR